MKAFERNFAGKYLIIVIILTAYECHVRKYSLSEVMMHLRSQSSGMVPNLRHSGYTELQSGTGCAGKVTPDVL